MRKRAEKALKELYDLTEKLSEPEITPVLKGSCRIQGPMDDLDHGLQTNSGVSPSEKRFGKLFLNENLHMRAESGTCNVCAAPCSSCMHFNRAVSVMESKIEGGFSENNCGRKETDHCSFIIAGVPALYKSRPCDDRQHAVSETSNLFSATSSHDSFSENAESKATIRTPDIYDTSEDVDLPLKVPSCEAVEEDQLIAKQHNVTAHCVFSSHRHTDSDLLHRNFSSQDEEHRGSECHGDNISCVTGNRNADAAVSDLSKNLARKNILFSYDSASSLLGKGFKMAGPVQAAHGEIEDSQRNSRRPSTCTKEFSPKKSSDSSSTNAKFSQKYVLSECPPPNGNPSPKEQYHDSHSHSQSGLFFFHSGVTKDMGENSNSQLQGEPSECSVEHVESSLPGQLTTSGTDGQKSITLGHVNNPPNYEDNKASRSRSDSFSEVLKNTHQCLETETGRDGGNPTNESTKCGILNMQEPQTQSQPTSEIDNTGPDILEDDVKVCDICGDAGREDLLAICSRCSDGAEHIYCMRIRLDEVPEGDWLCEECKLNEDAETQKVGNSETVSGMSTALCVDEKLQNVGTIFIPKLLPKLDIKAIDSEVPPQISTKRSLDYVDVTSMSNKKTPETSGGSTGTASSSRKPILSRESSFKNLDAGKVKPANLTLPFGSQPTNSSQVITRSPTFSGPNSSRFQARLQSPRGHLSKSSSFNNLKPKVKQVIENVPQKTRLAGESSLNDAKKEGVVRTINKSASFKSMSSGCLIVNEPTSKAQSLNPPQLEESRNSRQGKERITIERKNSFMLNRHPPNLSLTTTTSIPLSKPDTKAAQYDRKLIDSNTLIANKGSKDVHDMVGFNEVKKQPSYSSKTFGHQSSNGMCNFEDQRPCQVAPREDARASSSGNPDTVLQRVMPQSRQSTTHDEKDKDSTSFSSSRQSVSTASRVLRCQKCNETGHSAQFCSVDKLRGSALKPSVERNSRETTNKGNKWKDAVVAAISKSRIRKSNRLPDQSEELSLSSVDISCDIVSKIQLSSSGCMRDLTALEGTGDRQDNLRSSIADHSKTTDVIDVKQHSLHPKGTVCISRVGESNAFPIHTEESKGKPSMQMLIEQDSVLFDPLRVSAIPEHDYMWQGGFEVQRPGKLPELCDGVQAHLSTCASPKVLQVVTKFPSKVQLEEVPRLSSWPLQFQENFPTEENIALFFFAKDVESYEKNYKKLLENMLKNDLALKGNFDGIELLIFPSSKLPEKSQRWNRLFFLWGVFRGRRSNCSEPLSIFKTKLCSSNLNVEHMVQDLPSQLITEVPVSQKVSSHEDTAKEVFRHNRSIKTEAADIPHLSVLEAESICHINEPFGLKSLFQTAIDNKLPPEKHTSCSVPESDPGTSMNQQTSSVNTCRLSRLGIGLEQLCSEVKGGSSCLKEFFGGLDGKEDSELPLHAQTSSMQIGHGKDRVLPTFLVTSNCRQTDFPLGSQGGRQDISDSSRTRQLGSSLLVQRTGAIGSRNEEKMKDSERLIERATASDSGVWEIKTDELSSELRPNRKRGHSYSPESVSQISGEASKAASAKMAWKEECISPDERSESKKIKLYPEAPGSSSGEDILSERFSSEVHPQLASFVNEQLCRDSAHNETIMPESSRSSERYLFPVDTVSEMGVKSGNLIALQVLSSDDVDRQESDVPNLELALGAERKSPKQEILPLFSPLVYRKNNQDKPPYPSVDVADDISASLSLSLGFPFLEKEQATKPIPKTDQHLPERPSVSTSLLLFGGFAEN